MSEAKVKRERASAKGLFTKACNRLSEAIHIESEVDLIEAKFETLKVKWSDLQVKNDAYLAVIKPDGNAEEAGEEWITDVEEKFEVAEKAKFDYVRGKRMKYEEDAQVSKHKVEEEWSNKKSEVEAKRKKGVRDLQGKILKQEVNSLQELIKADSNGSMKVQIDEALKDVKIQLERCREAHMYYLDSLNTEIGEGCMTWLEELYKMRSKANLQVAEHLENLTRKRETIIKLGEMKLPYFNGEIRTYAKFKSDFNKYIMPTIKLSESAAYVLRSCLNEAVKNIIVNVEDKIDEIWKRLDEKYGDPSKLADIVINDIRKIRCIREGDIKGFMNLVETVERGYRDLALLDLEREVSNTGTVSIIEERLPRDIRREWSKEVNKDGSTVDVRDKFPALMRFLLEQRKIMDYEYSELRFNSSDTYKHRVNLTTESNYGQDNERVFQVSNDVPKCIVHRNANTHVTQECFNFKGMDVRARIQLIKDRRGCWSCLKIGHRIAECRDRKLCQERDCGQYHHPLLHEAPNREQVMSFKEEGEMCLLPVMSIRCKGKNINVLWDTGATISLITNTAARELNLTKGAERSLTIVKVGGTVEEVNSCTYVIPLVDKRKRVVNIEAYSVDTITSSINKVNTSGITYLFKEACKEDICSSYGEVDVLIGINYASIQPQKEHSIENLVLYGNRFGKCIAGSHKLLKGQNISINLCIVNNKNTMLDDFFSIEQMGVSCVPQCGNCKCGKCPIGGKDFTIKEERELRMIEDGLIHKGDHWECSYPWNKDPKLLPNNRDIVLKMLQSTERRLLKNPKKAKMYNEQIEDMVERNVARKLTDIELKEYKGPIFYLAHHAVVREDSKSTPCRIVFNSSAKMFGQMINDYWAKGPTLLTNLLGILIRFREEKYAIIGDIRKMFHAIKISTLDQNTHRFLWRNLNVDRKPEDYVMLSVSFGDKPSAGIAITALRKTADLSEMKYPEAAQVLKKSVYMDDIIDSFSTYSKASEIIKSVDKVLKLGNFAVKEWTVLKDEGSDGETCTSKIQDVSSSIKLLPEINNERKKSSANVKEDCSNLKVLGLEWERDSDCFKFAVEETLLKRFYAGGLNRMTDDNIEGSKILTKRVILSLVNGIYDPLGLITPVVVKAKILLKKLWCCKVGWDDHIPEEIMDEWAEFFQSVSTLKQVSFQRCIKPSNHVGDPILITFCDASEQAFGACCYLRWQNKKGGFEARLMASKSRVSPTKIQSIVRLEICGAVLGKRLAQSIERESRYDIERRYFIVDSQVVRSMIQKQSYGFNTFVAVRIGEIQEFTDPSEWFWIEGECNIADWITRGKEGYEIDSGSTWQNGPAFLKEDEKNWPIKGSITESLPEERISKFVYHVKRESTLSNIIDIMRFGNYLKLIRTTARVLSVFCEDVSLKNMLKEPSSEKFSLAEKRWIKDVQKSMRSDIEAGKYRRLNPCLNEEGLYIVSGRMEYWFEHTYSNKGLYLLPNDHMLSQLYSLYIHKLSHLGVAAIVSKIRTKFWIVKLPRLVKKIRFKCVTCRRLDKNLGAQIMAPLPMERLMPSPPFYNTSLDLFGPLNIKGEVNKRVRGKVFGVIFTCLCTRAVYCDLSQDYSTDAFLLVLRRFVSIHGYPKKIFSDPGSQLVAASKVIVVERFIEESEELKKFGVNQGMEWQFSTPDAPWQNGTAESLIKGVKRAIMVTIGEQIVTFSELQTVLFEVANLVNERPIGIHPKNPEDGSYLCPNDFLLGRASKSVPAGPFKEYNNLKRLTYVESLVDAVWKKWTRDYFASLIIRPKWHTSKRNLKIDDVVLMQQDSKSLRGNWKLGRVSQIKPGKDGFVRNVEVKYRSSPESKGFERVNRAVQKLILLHPVEEPCDK